MMARAGVDVSKWNSSIEGDKEIARHCSAYADVEISVHQVRRLRSRAKDPLPAEPIGQGERPRWVVKKSKLAAFAEWLRREFGA